MIAWNNQVTIESNDDSITIKYPKDIVRTLKIGEFKGTHSLYMYNEKGNFLSLGNRCPKIKTQLINDKKVAVIYIEVTDDQKYHWYNAAIKCNTVEELKSRIEELKNLLTKLWNKFQEIKSSKPESKYAKKRHNRFKFGDDSGFGKIEIPSEIDLSINDVVIKSEHDYVKELIDLYNNDKIAIHNGETIVYTEEFINIVNKLAEF